MILSPSRASRYQAKCLNPAQPLKPVEPPPEPPPPPPLNELDEVGKKWKKYVADKFWSAVFISYCVHKAVNNYVAGHPNVFIRGIAHTRFFRSNYSNAYGTAHLRGLKLDERSITAENDLLGPRDYFKHMDPRITMVKVGDVVLQPRKSDGKWSGGVAYVDGNRRQHGGTRYGGSSHSDIVVAVDYANRKCTVVGGNLSNKVKKEEIELDSEGKFTPWEKSSRKSYYYGSILRLKGGDATDEGPLVSMYLGMSVAIAAQALDEYNAWVALGNPDEADPIARETVQKYYCEGSKGTDRTVYEKGWTVGSAHLNYKDIDAIDKIYDCTSGKQVKRD